MITGTTRFHYSCSQGPQFHKEITHHFTKGSEEFLDEICLINTTAELTEFEQVPADIEKWVDSIGFDYSHFPNLSRLWGDGRSAYAFTLRYEISHDCDLVTEREYPVVLPYYVQLPLLNKAAEKISQTLPDTMVRLHERAAIQGQHELEIVFLYPCEPKKIRAACEILNSQFDYVWDIGREPVELAVVTPLPDNAEAEDAEKKEFELALPNGMTLVVNTDGDDAYPGIFISLREKPGAIAQLCCFVELDSDKPEGKQIYVGAYAQNTDDPTYYACYHEDGLPCE
jgi:hypothetical protein